MPSVRSTEVVLAGLVFPEGPRWRNDRLVFSDMHDQRVVALDPVSGASTTVCEVPNQPSGLGWQPDGTMLVVSMIDRKVLALGADGTLREHADLGEHAPFHCNDMVVDADGGAYVGNFGFDIFTHDIQPRATTLVYVDPDGRPSVAADGLQFPNGMVITPDDRTLVVGESWGARLTAFDIAGGGRLEHQRVWAAPERHVPDGICLDAEGAIWIACPASGDVVRVLEGGAISDVVSVSQTAYACMLGGADRTTLFVCVAPDAHPDVVKAKRCATIEAVEVDVPGAGRP